MQKHIDKLFPFFFIALSLFFWNETSKLPTDSIGQEAVDMKLFPQFCIVVIISLSCLMLAREVLFPPKNHSQINGIGKAGIIRIVLVTALMFLYAYSYEWGGFYLGTYALVLLLLLVLGERKALTLTLAPLLLVIFVHIGFVEILEVPLPQGELYYRFFG